jgi:predicted transglutaminase-like cysteine proteinase
MALNLKIRRRDYHLTTLNLVPVLVMKAFAFSVAACALALALGGCASEIPASTALADGPLTTAPAGWISYCARHAEDAGCPR